MSADWVIALVSGFIGFASAILAGNVLAGSAKRERRRQLLKILKRELDEFLGRLELAPLEPDDLSLVSTLNVTLLERAFVEDVWDYEHDSVILGVLADLIERIKRHNDNVKVVNQFSFGTWMLMQEPPNVVRDWLHASLQESVAAIDRKVNELVRAIDSAMNNTP